MGGILSGVRVLDLSSGLAGSVAALLLAECGAEVIKVEPPDGVEDQHTAAYHVWNRSKRRLGLDLPKDRARLDSLIDGADVLISEFTPAGAHRLGLEDEALAGRHPRLIVCNITGYPVGHPLQETPVRGTLVLGLLGLLDEQQGRHRDGPIHLRFPLADWCAAYLAADAVMARLVARQKTGRGGIARTSLAQGALVPMAMHWYRATQPSESLARGMPKTGTPGLFECADGVWIHIMRCPDATPAMKRELDALPPAERTAFAATPSPSAMFPNYAANVAIMRARPSADWLAEFWAHDIPAQPALEMGEIYGDPECAVNGFVLNLRDPAFGDTVQPGHPLKIDPPMQVAGAFAPLEADVAWRGERLAAEPEGQAAGPPLAGLKVVDFGSHLAGPLAPMLMADLGADVIKVESPRGEQMRPQAEGAFMGCQRNKRDLALELKKTEAQEVLARLVARADVVHHNMRMPAAHKLGLDYERLRGMKPDLVYSHVSTYGPEGARKDWPGMDQMSQAMTGWERAGAGEGNPPHWHRFGFMDHLAAMGSVMATLLALYHRNRTGEGQAVAASLLGAGLMTVGETILAEGALTPFAPLDRQQTGVSPEHGVYRCADGWVAVAALRRAEAAALHAVAGASDRAGLEAFFAPLGQAEALAKLAAGGVPAAPVRLNQRDAFLTDPDNLKCRIATVYEDTRYGRFEHVGAFWSFGDADIRLDTIGPDIGEHTDEVLAELGFDREACERLLGAGVVAGAAGA
jgi:crotonobetainyl-CoA:carnitine CoA-transferase CaiB-like acyl-CoA transferase